MPTSLKSVSESPYAVGDIVKTAKGSPGANFVPTDGAKYTQSSKSLLYAAIGKIKDVDNVSPTLATLPSAINCLGIAYGAGLFVAVGHGNQGSTAVYFTSPDGVTWTQRALPSASYWIAVTYGNGRFVAICGGTQSNNTYGAWSTDGINWTGIALPVSTTWSHITYGGGLFIASSFFSSATNNIATSPDGVTWTTRTQSVSRAYGASAYGAGLYVVMSSSGTYVTSPDGVTWTQRTIGLFGSVVSLVYAGGQFVGVTNQGDAVVSADGLTWKMYRLPYGTQNGTNTSYPRAITYGDGVYVCVGGSQTSPASHAWASYDGKKWFSISSITSSTWSAVAYGVNTFAAISGDGIVSANTNALAIPIYSYNPATEFVVPNQNYGYIKFSDVV